MARWKQIIMFVALTTAPHITSIRAGIFEGIVDGKIATIDSAIEVPYDVGDHFRFVYFFDSNAHDLDPESPIQGIYSYLSGSLNIGEDRVEFGNQSIDYPNGFIFVHAYAPLNEDEYVVNNHLSTAFAGMTAPVIYVVLDHWSSGQRLLSSDALPLNLTADDFEWRFFSLEDQSHPGPRVVGSIDSVAIVPTPEPSSIVLGFLVGTLAIGSKGLHQLLQGGKS